jgi:hypothetical protein
MEDRFAHRSSDPATREELGTIPEMGIEETKDAINAAGEAFVTWSKTTAKVTGHRFVLYCQCSLTRAGIAPPRHSHEILQSNERA